MDQMNVTFRGTDTARRLLLKTVQHVHSLGKSHGVNRSKRVTQVVFYQLKNACTFAFPGFRLCRGCTDLHSTQGITKVINDLSRQFNQVFFGRSNPVKRLFSWY